LNFCEFRKRKQALAVLEGLSHFDDDGEFLVVIDDDLPIKRKIKAPSQVVLEHAAYRCGLDEGVGLRITRVS